MPKPDMPVGTNLCYCTQCDEYFNSVAAFDHHLKRKGRSKRGVGREGAAEHDISGMPRNKKGNLVISLPPVGLYS